nr:GDSL-type esterase/lipase family protein [Armatimonadota bacterium]
DGGLVVGQTARISDQHGFFGEATVTALKDNGDKTWTATLEKDLGVPAGAKLNNPRRNGAGFKIIGCRLGNTRSRGILIKADDGVIQDNTLQGCGMSAVSLGPEYDWNEANYVSHVLIERNYIIGNGAAGYGGSAILIHGDGAIGNRDITIRGNTFVSNYQGDIDAQWVDGLTVDRNVLHTATKWPEGTSPPSSILLANSRNIKLSLNEVGSGYEKSPPLKTGPNLADVTGNDVTGIYTTHNAISTAHIGVSIHDGAPTDTNIRFIGRWDEGDANVYHSNWGGAYLRAAFTGSSIGFKGGATAGGPNVMVSVDGEPLHEVKALNVEDLKPGPHTLLVGAPNQNSEFDFKGLVLAPGATTLPVEKLPIIEFVGDSITTGGGQTLPSTVNYAWLTGEALHADHTQIAFSARALTTGYGCAGDKAALDTQYFLLKNFNHTDEKPQVPWNFSYTPSMIVINLGQNDQCGGEKDEVFTASLIHFIQRIRARLPQAQIVALRPFGGPYEKAVREAIATLNAAGDGRVHYIDTTGWLEKGDFVDGVHPTEAGHGKVAARLAPLLKPLLDAGVKAP